MAVKEFLKSKVFLKHLLIIIGSFFVLLFLVSMILKLYTRHGEEYEIPQIVNKNVSQVIENSEYKNFEIIALDSVFKDGVPSGTILTQDPRAGSIVKKGRKIYITVASNSCKMISMPLCTDKGLKSAIQTLVDAGLRVENIMYRTGEVDNVVVSQTYKNKPISKGSDIVSGQAVGLVVEVRDITKKVRIPDITGKTQKDAEIMLWKAGLNVGKKICQGAIDDAHTRVVSFSPSNDEANIGTAINLTLMNDTEKAYRRQLEDFRQEREIERQIEQNDSLEEEPIEE